MVVRCCRPTFLCQGRSIGMLRVRHQHCVDLIASCTDILLSSPVADMDLSNFLKLDLDSHQMKILSRSVGCITSALAYLHSLHIRHDDLKPGNILIHGDNVLLTDFGFCLDSSDNGITTTAGPPMHSTRRYSAPEVFEHTPRSRLTDIWSLGCVLSEIVSRLLGYTPDTMKSFWLSYGLKIDSYAENPDATTAWFTLLTCETNRQPDFEEDIHWLISFIQHILLEPKRLLRPTAAQLLASLNEMNHLSGAEVWMGRCCSRPTDVAFCPNRQRWLAMDMLYASPDLDVVFLNTDLQILAGRFEPRLYPVIRQVLGGETDFLVISSTVKRLITRNPGAAMQQLEQQADVTYDEFVKSWCISQSSQLDALTVEVNLRLGCGNMHRYEVDVILMTLQLERRPMYGAHFITIVVSQEQHRDQVISMFSHPAQPNEQDLLDSDWTPNSFSLSPSSIVLEDISVDTERPNLIPPDPINAASFQPSPAVQSQPPPRLDQDKSHSYPASSTARPRSNILSLLNPSDVD